MTRILASLAAMALLTGPLVSAEVAAQSRSFQPQDEQSRAREQMQAGRNMSIRDIERRILPQMGGDEYIGFEYDPAASAYRLKFIRDGRVVFVDVDARSGNIISQSR